ncbi:MAG: hypothetical protein IPH57_17105 [Saprospiraceae bacterium]|nr:hypothetical protein [Saprospiraceae bacterium]
MTGCDLFGDEEHCLYTSNESKIWTPGNNPAVADYGNIESPDYKADYYNVYFAFNRTSGVNSLFKIENSCPVGVIDFKVNIVEKLFIDTKPFVYNFAVYQIKVVKGKKILDLFGEKKFVRKTDTELYVDYVVPLDGLLEEGPREYTAVCYANFDYSNFSDLLEAEEWAKNNIVKVEYKANFVKWD